jgi:putative phosphotransacetylase
MSLSGAPPHRAVVEHLVRRIVYERLGKAVPRAANAPSPLVVNVSARHCHLSREAIDALFGKGHELSPMRPLYQDGHYAAKETVTLVGPRSRVISNLRILGPSRDASQVELSFSDAVALGFDLPVRLSGDLSGTPGCMVMGPAGFYPMEQGVIRAAPHIHMSPADASFYGTRHLGHLKLKVGGECPVTIGRLQVRVHESFKLEAHIDTDEGNACNLKPDSPCQLLPVTG